MVVGFIFFLVKILNFKENLNVVGIYFVYVLWNFEMYIKYMIGLMVYFIKLI